MLHLGLPVERSKSAMSDKKSFQRQVYLAPIGIEWEANSLPALCAFCFPSALWETVFINLNLFYATMGLDLKKTKPK